jgi:hypothetical protein
VRGEERGGQVVLKPNKTTAEKRGPLPVDFPESSQGCKLRSVFHLQMEEVRDRCI